MPANYKLANDQWERYTYCRDTGHIDFVMKAEKCDSYFQGLQWDPTVLGQLREQRRPGLTINKILGTFSSIMGEQIDLRTEIAFKARYGAPSGNADALTKLFRFISDKNNLNYLRSEMFADGGITSRGYLDIRMDYSKSVTGDVVISLLNPKNVIPDPDASEYDPDQWADVMVTKWLSCDEIEHLYNKADADVLRRRTDGSWSYGYDSVSQFRDRFGGNFPQMNGSEAEDHQSRKVRIIERQYKKLTTVQYFVDVKTGDRQCVPDTYDNQKIAETVANMRGRLILDKAPGYKIRWTVTADDIVLKDEWSPYEYFTIIPYFPYFRHGKTIGLIENLLDPQDLLNKTTSQELHVVNTTANSGWKVKQGALANMTPDELEEHGAASGLVIEVNGDPEKDIVKISPNQIPQGLDRLSMKAESYLKSVSMRGDAQMGMARADASGDQMEQNIQQSDVSMRKPLDNLKVTDTFIARMVLHCIQQFYTDPRIMMITHNDLTGEQTQFAINWPDPKTGELMNDLTMGDYDFTVVSQSVKSTLQQAQFEQGVMLREKLGIQIPDEFLLENSNLINKSGIIAALKAQSQTPEAQLTAKVQTLTQELGVANLKADASKAEADALLKRSKAAKEVAQTAEIAGQDPTKDADMAREDAKAQQTMALDQQKHEQKMQHEKEKHQNELTIRKSEAVDSNRLKRAQAIMAMRQQAQKSAGGASAGAAK